MVCVDGMGFLVYALVKLVRTPPHSTGDIVIVSIFLVFWLRLNASIYPAFYGSLFSWSTLGRCLEPPLNTGSAHCGARDRPCAREGLRCQVSKFVNLICQPYLPIH
ncbi:hypothetical protein BDA96_07G132500 [Sorghum bicolor]|uniref:Uncharacterized protein n=2 Tax=Sorghum bicolor TaxID=4558 RepID=A0A921QKG7_SORBI|nr:hypothetical protein BDA96_07G132500 [Sorghum bicolor]KXG25124.1 hypothetical protein SORBI_3007G123700 [Sorghum bicolor]